MGLFGKTSDKLAKSYARGLCNTMLKSVSTFKEKYPGKTGFELFSEAIKTRPGWHEKEHSVFQYKKAGSIDLKGDDSLRSVLIQIVYCELPSYLDTVEVEEQTRLIGIAVEEIENYKS